MLPSKTLSPNLVCCARCFLLKRRQQIIGLGPGPLQWRRHAFFSPRKPIKTILRTTTAADARSSHIALPHRQFSLFAVETVPLNYLHFEPRRRRFRSQSQSQTEQQQTKLNTPLVIVHGLFGQSGNWKSVGKALAHRLNCEVYTVDLRNHGDSPWDDNCEYSAFAADVREFIETEVLDLSTVHTRVHLMGHSLGGKAACLLALSQDGEDIIDRLIIEDVVPHRTYTADDRQHAPVVKYAEALLKLSAEFARLPFRLTDARAFANSYIRENVPQSDQPMRDFLLMNLIEGKHRPGHVCWRVNVRALHAHLNEIFGFPNHLLFDRAFLGKTMFIHGEKSDYVKSSDRDQLRHLFPMVEFVTVPGAGHWVHSEQPYKFMDEVTRFLSKK